MSNEANEPDVFSDVERQYMPAVMESVRRTAVAIAKRSGRESAIYVDVVRAFEERFGESATAQHRGSFWREHLFLAIAAVMTVTFGFMGLLPYLLNMWKDVAPEKFGYTPGVFLDIAKLFAGVLVGGAAGITVKNVSTGSRGET